MNKKIISTIILGCLTMVQINMHAQDTASTRNSLPVGRNLTGEFAADIVIGLPLMPKMTSISGFGIHLGLKVVDKFPLIQGFYLTGGYVNRFKKSKLKHNMVFSGNNSSEEVEVVYDNSVVIWGIGLKHVSRKEEKSRPYFEGNIGMFHVRNNLHLQSGGFYYDNLPDSWTELNRDRVPFFNLGIGIELGRPESQTAFFAGIRYMRSFSSLNYTHHKFMALEPRPKFQSGGTDMFMDFIDFEELPSNVYNHKVAELYSYPLQLMQFCFGIAIR